MKLSLVPVSLVLLAVLVLTLTTTVAGLREHINDLEARVQQLEQCE